MNWTHIKLIVSREIRDQLRDRRTIFVIAILPLLLYPLLGMSFLQVAQFMKEHPTKVWLIGADQLDQDPKLLVGDTFRLDLLTVPSDERLFEISTEPIDPASDVKEIASKAVSSGQFDAVVFFSPEFIDQVTAYSKESDASTEQGTDLGPEVFYNVAKDKSRVSYDRIISILSRWRAELVERSLAEKELPPATAKPFQMVRHDLSADSGRRAAVWSKILPFIIIIWAMTGAFYPAIDLCAGEKERGTLETLLSCPASRHDIVIGKLLTVMVFSMATSLLNLFSMGFTGNFVMSQLQSISGLEGMQLGPPPLATLGWLVVALIPVAALFSALSLALAAMARSSKEGQYYLMPLMLGTMPMMMLPMMPGMELDLGNSLIPVTGVVLLLRSLIEGDFMVALQHVIPVVVVTLICCWLALLWAIHQFQDERVLFHESEQFSLKSWILHIMRDRGAVPTIAQAFLCGIMLLLIRFFAAFILPMATDWNTLLLQNSISQIGLIAGPAILLALLLTRKPTETLLLKKPAEGFAKHLGLAVLLAVVMHPIVSAFSNGIRTLYPISESTMAKLEAFQSMLVGAPNMYLLLLMMAVLPAICEELAFRGFILSGLRRMNNKWLAVLVSSLFFGIAHQMLQQSITAFAVGMLIGYIAIQTKSIFPCMLYHVIHNSLPLLIASWMGETGGVQGYAEIRNDALYYGWPLVSVCIAAAIVILWRFQHRDFSEAHDVPVDQRAFGV